MEFFFVVTGSFLAAPGLKINNHFFLRKRKSRSSGPSVGPGPCISGSGTLPEQLASP